VPGLALREESVAGGGRGRRAGRRAGRRVVERLALGLRLIDLVLDVVVGPERLGIVAGLDERLLAVLVQPARAAALGEDHRCLRGTWQGSTGLPPRLRRVDAVVDVGEEIGRA